MKQGGLPTPRFLCRSFPARAEGPFSRNQKRWFFIGHSGASTEISMLSSDPARLCGGKAGTQDQGFARRDSSIMAPQPGREHKTGGGQEQGGLPILLLWPEGKGRPRLKRKKIN